MIWDYCQLFFLKINKWLAKILQDELEVNMQILFFKQIFTLKIDHFS